MMERKAIQLDSISLYSSLLINNLHSSGSMAYKVFPI